MDLRRLRLAHLELGRMLYRVHPTALAAGRLNASGRGETRFAPLAGGAHAYLADTATVALLETCFHDVHQEVPRVVYAATDLAGRSLSGMVITGRMALADLRDEQLLRLGLTRKQLVATTPAHYPCTRAWAAHLMERRIGGVAPVGLVWNSRVAELARADSMLLEDLLAGRTSEVCVVYDVTSIAASGVAYQSLVDGQGRLLVDYIVEQLDAEIA